MYGKKVSFLARGDSELNWDVNPCTCKSCNVLDELIVDVEIEVRVGYTESERSAILASLLEKLKKKGDQGTAKVEIIRDDKKEFVELLFVHVDPRKRNSKCKRSGYYFFDFFRSEKNVYYCRNGLKRPRKSKIVKK